MTNLALPGNPRYQPKSLIPIFGYDNLIRPVVEVEIAVMKTLAKRGVIPLADMLLLTDEIEKQLLAITTSEVDRVERQDTEYGKATSHDIRALVRIMQKILPEPLRRWVHIPLTSYDVLDTARVLMFLRAHEEVVQPKVKEVIASFASQARQYAHMVQVGRTHGQHALPITVGFWMATILSRLITNARQMDTFATGLRGKISGAVGAYNAQAGLGIYDNDGESCTFELAVLLRLNITPAPISTQILPPEPLAYYLTSCAFTSAALGQYGRDCRNLMRIEIGELSEPFEEGQVGSSTMAHKRNPLHFENLEGMWEGVRAEMGKVSSLLVSEHQRDLVGSSVARDLPVIVVKLVYQLETLLRKGKGNDPRPFVERVMPDAETCLLNLEMQGNILLAEPLYIALQMAGYTGDAHHLVNHHVVETVKQIPGLTLIEAMNEVANRDKDVRNAWDNVPAEMKELLRDPTRYIGKAAEKTFQICDMADEYIKRA